MDWQQKIKTALCRPVPFLTPRELSSAEKARRLQRSRKISKIVGVGIALFCCVFFVWRLYLAHQVRTRFDHIAAAKLPTSGAELNAWYPEVPDSENAALLLTNVFSSLKPLPDGSLNNGLYKLKPSHGRPLSADDWQLISQYVEINKASLAAAENVLFKNSRYPIDLTLGYKTLLPHLAGLKSLAMVADFDARLAIRTGDTVRALKSWMLMLHLAATLDAEPTVISQLVRIAVIKMAVRSLEYGLSAQSLTEAQTRELMVNLESLERTNSMVRALAGERVMAIQAFRQGVFEGWHSNDSEDARQPTVTDANGIERAFVRVTGFFEHDLNFYLGTMESALPICEQAPPSSLKAERIFINGAESSVRKLCLLSSMLLPAYAKLMSKQTVAVASIDTARLVLSTERFRGLHGKLPTDLNEIRSVADVPNDPFTGLPLKYIRLPKGYVVYSLGPDRFDDDAKEEPKLPKPGDQWDITFFVER